MNTSPTDLLVFKNVGKVYPGPPKVEALSDISLRIPKSAFAGLIGPSGSGKTTLLNLASGLDTPSSGEIFLLGHNVATMSLQDLCHMRQRQMGFVFQAYNLFSVLTAVENVEYTSLIRGDSAQQARQRASEALNLVGLAEKMHSFPRQLSGGQQQRVAVARALAAQAEVIFADEPTANLDTKSAFQLIDLFEKLNGDLKVAFVFSTHDARLVDRIKQKVEMIDGKVVKH